MSTLLSPYVIYAFSAGFVLGALSGSGLWLYTEWRRKRESRELDKFIVMEDYRVEAGAKDGDLIHFECANGHKAARHLEQFGTLPNCTHCGGLMEPVGFTPVVK